MSIQEIVWRARRDGCKITISDGDLVSYLKLEGINFKLEILACEDGISIELLEGKTIVDIKNKRINVKSSEKPEITIS